QAPWSPPFACPTLFRSRPGRLRRPVMSDILQRILAVKRDEVDTALARLPLAQVRREAAASAAAPGEPLAPRGFAAALQSRVAEGERKSTRLNSSHATNS